MSIYKLIVIEQTKRNRVKNGELVVLLSIYFFRLYRSMKFQLFFFFYIKKNTYCLFQSM